jgi:hypothetical protein
MPLYLENQWACVNISNAVLISIYLKTAIPLAIV